MLSRQRLTLAVACMAQVMMVLDVLIVSVALPSMQHELHLSPAGLEWVVSAYALALAALIPLGGALGDHFGRKLIFLAGVIVFTLASVGCALSVSGGMLIGFRVVQGIGGAVMSSLTLSLISEAYPPEARAGPIGIWAAVSGLAVAGGSVLGGLLLSVFPWSSIFWVNVPIGVLTVVITLAAVAESREPVPRPFDRVGVALSAFGLLLLTFGFVDSADATWGSPVVGCVHRRRGSGPGGLLRVGAQGRVPDGPPGITADPGLRPGLCGVPAGLPGVLGIHLLRHAIFPEC